MGDRGRTRQHPPKANGPRFHGDPDRFPIMAEFIGERFGASVEYVADVAGGQGMLARELRKRFNYRVEVVDPRGWTLKGVESRAVPYVAEDASYYDLVVGLHPDQALREVVHSATARATVIVPCCNFWRDDRKLGRDALAESIAQWLDQHDVRYERVTFPFRGPQNLGFVTTPPNAVS
ncbi:hypothetical protein [Actinoplanes sp. NPDC051494]|uniref:hypothetical protein n=1 Tax=Actinoplanes sp. NPDC051494 TaxID=3363907 RepID=UPI0037B0993C